MDNYNQEIPPNDFEQAIVRKETPHPFNKPNLTSINGRMGRLDFAILYFSLLLLGLIVQKAFGVNQLLVGFSVYSQDEIISKSLIQTAVIIGLIQLILFALLSVKRFHDINYSGWLALIFLVPLVNLGLLSLVFIFVGFILRLILLFAKGEANKNRFGDIPIGNHRNKLFLLIGVLILNYLAFSSMYREAFPIINPIIEQLLLQMQNQ